MPPNERLVSLSAEKKTKQRALIVLVMRQLVEEKVCALLLVLSVTLYFMISFCYTENVGEITGRAVRTNRGQGGHAYQLEKALNPITGDQVHNKAKANERIPESVPVNAMAPQALGKTRSGGRGVISVFNRYFLIITNFEVISRIKSLSHDIRLHCLKLVRCQFFKWLWRTHDSVFLLQTGAPA